MEKPVDVELFDLLTDPENQPNQYVGWLTIGNFTVTCCCGESTEFTLADGQLADFARRHYPCLSQQ